MTDQDYEAMNDKNGAAGAPLPFPKAPEVKASLLDEAVPMLFGAFVCCSLSVRFLVSCAPLPCFHFAVAPVVGRQPAVPSVPALIFVSSSFFPFSFALSVSGCCC